MRGDEELTLDRSSALTRLIERVESAGPRLRALDDDRIERAIAGAAAMLSDAQTPVGAQAIESIPAHAELSRESVSWALGTSLDELRPASIADARRALERASVDFRLSPVRLAGVVLAGNIFTAALRPLTWALLCRVPVVCKVASTDAGLAELFHLALTLVDEDVGASIGVTRFSRDDTSLLSRLASAVDVLSMHGSDRTIQSARAMCSAGTEFVGHGHGLGVVLIPKEALGADADIGPMLELLALDIAAYDQGGCLSPHAVLVERGGATSARELGRRLSEEALATFAARLPRAALSVEEGAAQVRWRGVAHALGELFEGDGWSVSYEADGPLRACPLSRNIAVHEVESVEAALRRVAAFGAHLKVVGVAGTPESRDGIGARLAPGLAPRVCALGTMQRPPLSSATDGVSPWQGLIRSSSRR